VGGVATVGEAETEQENAVPRGRSIVERRRARRRSNSTYVAGTSPTSF
jgi:hypothetical protein